mmetsp:Transcript_21305/g.46147  ORF Transcript_21305/g.46147 Transcript_21305/m.46147 type:complete len:207 (+) Transcript_21305:259-879(+)
MLSSLDVELLARLGIVLEDLRRLEVRPPQVPVSVHLVHELLRALRVQHAEGPAQERGKADAEDCADVSVGGCADDLVLQAVGGLVDEARDHPELNVLHTQQRGVSAACLRNVLLQHGHHLWVDLLLVPLLGLGGVQVEALAGLAAQEPLVDHLLHQGGIPPLHAHPQVRFGHEGAHVVGDVDAHLVGEGYGPNGHAEGLHRLVQGL